MPRPRLRGQGPTSRPPRQWQIDVAVGAALLTVGAGGVLTLIVAAALASPAAWCQLWFWVAVIPFALLTGLGGYMLAAVYVELPLPEPRASREAKAQLTVGDINTPVEEPRYAVVEFPLQVGWRDIDNASINVVVPDFVEIRRSNSVGEPLALEGRGSMAHTSETLADSRTESNYWNEARMHFSAFTNQSLWFRLDFDASVGPFPVLFRLSASALQGAVEAQCKYVKEEGGGSNGP
jgi:hypothetical protein